MKNPTVSLIVTTKNEAEHIARCLRSIKQQSYKKTEIIVVDNNSTDDTEEIARRFTKYVFTKGPERSAQRNFGAKKASGTFVLFIDADMVLTPNVVVQCVKSSQYLGIVIPEKSFGVGFWARCKALERTCYENVTWIESARFFRKDIFLQSGGYNEELTGPEDFELPQRIKSLYGDSSIGRIDSYILHDEGSLSLAKLLQKKYYYGKRMRQYSRIKGSNDYFRKQSNIVLRYWLFFRRPKLFFQDPIHYVGMLFMKTLEMSAVAMGAL